MSKATIRDIMYLFKYSTYVIWLENGNSASYEMNWDTCWKYCREKGILDDIPNSCSIFDGVLNINL